MHLARELLRTLERTTGVRKMRHLFFALVALAGAIALAANAGPGF